MLQALISLVYAIVPVLFYLWIVWTIDRYDREPMGLVLANFGWGIIVAILILGFGLLSNTEYDKTLTAPIVEETLKCLILFWTARQKAFDNITDGMVYGMAIGLGFGMTENFVWFWNASTVSSWVTRVLGRTLFTVIMHALATGLVGTFFGLTKFGKKWWRLPVRLLGLAAAIGIHMFWNTTVISYDGTGIPIDTVFILLGLVSTGLILQMSLLAENRILRRELTEESESGLIPVTHLQYLPYSTKRKFLGWLSPAIDKREYIEATTQLAFRRYQAKMCQDDEREKYEQEVEALRQKIRAMLASDTHSAAAQLY